MTPTDAPLMPATLQVHLTPQGSLHLAADIADRHFPGSALVALPRPPELWLLPINTTGGGGLLLKRRNAAGDRAVLIWEHLPPGTPPGDYPAFWDDEQKALRVGLSAVAAPPGPG